MYLVKKEWLETEMMGFQLLTYKSYVYTVSVKISVKIVSLLGNHLAAVENDPKSHCHRMFLWRTCWQTITHLYNLLLLGNLGWLS